MWELGRINTKKEFRENKHGKLPNYGILKRSRVLGIKYAFRNFKEENDEITRENLRDKSDENEGKRNLQRATLDSKRNSKP